MKILAVDDDPDLRALLEPALARQGFSNVTLAESAEDALRIIKNAAVPFDCFILDIQMPDIDGIELCRRIRGLDEYQDALCIMLTSMSDRKYIDGAFAAGATDYLIKPIDEVEIRVRLNMGEKLISAQRRQFNTLAPSNNNMSTASPSYGFNDSIPMKQVDGAIDLLAMENYLKTLGIFRAFSLDAIGVKVSNARQIYDMEGGSTFGDMMLDIATCLSDCLKGQHRMIAYFGAGQFVCLVERQHTRNSALLAETLAEYILEFEMIYNDSNITLPIVEMGAPVRQRASFIRAPGRLLQAALDEVQTPAA